MDTLLNTFMSLFSIDMALSLMAQLIGVAVATLIAVTIGALI